MLAEVKTLVWLQWILLKAAFRGGVRLQRAAAIVLIGVLGLMALPAVVGGAIALAVLFFQAPMRITVHVAAIVNTIALFVWLFMPTARTSVIEGVDLPKLFAYPISLRGMIAGGMIANLFNPVALFTIPFLAAELFMALRTPLGLPGSLLAIVLFGFTLAATTEVMEDMISLIAEDRRLRTLVTMLALVPVVIYVSGQFYFQALMMRTLGTSGHLTFTTGDFLSRFPIADWLIWTPGGMAAKAIQATSTGDFMLFFAVLAGLLLYGAVLFRLHMAMSRRLFTGMTVHWNGAAARLNPGRLAYLAPGLPGPAAFWALAAAELKTALRTPGITTQFIGPVIFLIMAVTLLAAIDLPPLVIAAGVAAMTAFTFAITPGHNLFGMLDRHGLSTLITSPLDTRLVVPAANMAMLAINLVISLLQGVVLAILFRNLLMIPATLYATTVVFLLCQGAANLPSVLAPYRMNVERGQADRGQSTQSFIGIFPLMLGMPLLVAPAVILVALGVFVLPALLFVAEIAALAYAVVVYLGLLLVASTAFKQRAPTIAQRVVQEA